MAMVKICKSCGTENAPSELMCTGCLSALSGIKPVSSEEIENSMSNDVSKENFEASEVSEIHGDRDSSDTLFEQSRTMILVFSKTGRSLSVRSGDILGREGVGKREFVDYLTVSRKHAKISCDGERWMIEDLESKNGTWVNGKSLKKGSPLLIRSGDVLFLSKLCELSVK